MFINTIDIKFLNKLINKYKLPALYTTGKEKNMRDYVYNILYSVIDIHFPNEQKFELHVNMCDYKKYFIRVNGVDVSNNKF